MAESLGDLLRRGWQLHQEHRYAEAEAAYRQVLEAQPDHPAALYCFGRLALDVRNLNVAADCLARAATADPAQSLYQADLAQALQALARYDEAIASYRRALELEPAAAVCVNLGNTLLAAGRAAEATAEYRRALDLDPNLAEAHSCLGAVLEQEGRLDEAIACYRRAVELRGDFAYGHFNLGTALRNTDRMPEALEHLETAARLAPNFPPAHHNLGVLLRMEHRPAEAQTCFERAVELDPTSAAYHYNLGAAIDEQGHPEAALAHYDEAIRRNPADPQARCSRGLALLQLGRFREGWADHEFRVGLPQYDTLSFPQPLWDGSPLGDRRLLVHTEAGLGDTLHFIRYLRLIEPRGDRAVTATSGSLIPLLAQSGFKNLVDRQGELPPFDVHIPLISLPRVLGTELDSIPTCIPYLRADPERVASWRARLAALDGLRVGIHWQGNPRYWTDRYRSIPLDAFAPLARVPGVRLVSLQQGPGRDQLAAARFEVHDLGPQLDSGGAFLDTAAVMQSLDLVITSDTAPAHLAGGLGARVWVALSKRGEWRWLLDREDSPWYPTMRLFRQPTLGDWQSVFERMAAELAPLAAASK